MQTFFCNNCGYQQHQCFVCGKLGSSDQSSAQEVFQCANAECGHFYHPKCVAELLQGCDALKTKELQLRIHSGESFACPAHKCNVCMEGEDKAFHELQFAMCRRCPKAYHRKCLPSEITFRSDGNTDQRAWVGLLRGRILIYCMDHEILSDIGTPKRDHIIFPNVEGTMQTALGLLSSKEELIKSRDMGNFAPRSPLNQRFNHHTGIYRGHSTYATITGGEIFRHTNIDKSKLATPRRTMYLTNSSKGKISDYLKQSAVKFMKVKGSSSQHAVSLELKLRMLKLIEDSRSSFNIEESLEGKKSSSLYSSNVSIAEDKTFTDGKVKGDVKAFYLPGSVGVNGKKLEQHNNLAPPLYLWSRPEWTTKHKARTETCGRGTVTYDPIQMGKMNAGENHDGMYEDMEVDPPINFQSNSAVQKDAHDWNSKGFYPSRYATRLEHSYDIPDTTAMGMQRFAGCLPGYHEDPPQHPSVSDSDSVEGVLQGALF